MTTTEDHLDLVPPLVEIGKFIDLVNAGQTISASISPADNSLAVFITNSVSFWRSNRYPIPLLSSIKGLPSTRVNREDEQPVYFASRQAVPSSERRLVRSTVL